MSPVVGRTSLDAKPITLRHLLRREIAQDYSVFKRNLARGESEALQMGLRYALLQRGPCGHGRGTGDDDTLFPMMCGCAPSDFVLVPRWLLAAAEGAARQALESARGSGGQHDKITKRFRDNLKDLETYRLVSMMMRGGKTLAQACASFNRKRFGADYGRTIRKAFERVADPKNRARYLRARMYQATFPKLIRESHFDANRANAIERAFGAPIETMAKLFEWAQRNHPTSPRRKISLIP